MKPRTASTIALAILCGGAVLAQQKAPAKSLPPAKAPASQALHLVPQLTPGQVLHYQIELRTTTENRHEGLVQDPQAATQLEISWNAIVRVEVLSLPPNPAAPARPAGARPPVRIRTTYEKSTAAVRSDSFDPAAALMEKQYQDVEGHVIEFTLGSDGKVGGVKGLEDVVTDEQAASAARQWATQLVTGAAVPPGGIVKGQHWTSERPAESAPLAGIVWRTDSAYLRDEACHAASPPAAGAPPAPAAASDETCAVIVTHLALGQPKPLRDPTPDDYRKRGLRTSGTWRGTGESLSYISRRTGWVVSSTQSGTENMNVTITSASNRSSVRYAGRVRSESHITLLPEGVLKPAP